MRYNEVDLKCFFPIWACNKYVIITSIECKEGILYQMAISFYIEVPTVYVCKWVAKIQDPDSLNETVVGTH